MSAEILRFPTRPSRLALQLERFGNDRTVLLMIWALYFALRAGVLAIGVAPASLGELYFTQAASLVGGHGYGAMLSQPTPPGWPMVLSLVFAQFGASPVVLGLFNLTCAMFTGLLTLAVARRISGSEAVARAALLLLAIYPSAIGHVPLALDGTFLTALLIAACWTLVARTSRWQLFTAGLLFGLAALIEPETLIAIPLLFAVDGLRKKNMLQRLPGLLGEALLVLGVSALVVMPWAVSNLSALSGWAAALPGNDLTGRLARLWLDDASAGSAYRAGAPGYEMFYHAAGYANDVCYSILMLTFIAAFAVILVKRMKTGQGWSGWWLLPYAMALYPVLACLAVAAPSRFAVMPFVCISAGWLVITGWKALAERGRPVGPTLH